MHVTPRRDSTRQPGPWAATLLLLIWSASQAESALQKSARILGDGTRFVTPCFLLDSGVPGPTVVVVGGIHGDEPAGAEAADEVRDWPILRGRLIVIPRANPPALDAKTRLIPGAPRELANLNRNFPKAGSADPPRGEPARALWECLKACRPDWLLDLHEGSGFHQKNSKTVGSTIIASRSPETDTAAELLLEAVNRAIPEGAERFVRLGLPADGSLVRAAGEHLGVPSLILESTVEDQPRSRRTRQHRVMVHRLLVHLGMVDPTLSVDQLTPLNRQPGKIHVAIYDAEGTGGSGVPQITEILAGSPDFHVVRIGPAEIAGGALGQFHVVLFPGGSGSRQAKAIGSQGAANIRRFVEQGGGYVGICAGAYLATSEFSWGLKILDAKTVSSKWRRGMGNVTIELTEAGREILGDLQGEREIRYANGPILMPAEVPSVPDYEVLALFRRELAKNDTPPGVMIHSPAFVAGQFGHGRVFCSSPHPEQTQDLEEIVRRAVRWASRCGD